jgi:hypothetical protein
MVTETTDTESADMGAQLYFNFYNFLIFAHPATSIVYMTNKRNKNMTSQTNFTFSGLCSVIYLLNNDQQDALFFFNLFEYLSSTCFE